MLIHETTAVISSNPNIQTRILGQKRELQLNSPMTSVAAGLDLFVELSTGSWLLVIGTKMFSSP